MRNFVTVVLVVALTACGSAERDPQDAIDDVAEASRAQAVIDMPLVPPADALPGAPTDYDRAVAFDTGRGKCQVAGIECGAVLEVWADEESAERRSAYLLAMQQGTVGLGVERHIQEGRLLLRVNGVPSDPEMAKLTEALAG